MQKIPVAPGSPRHRWPGMQAFAKLAALLGLGAAAGCSTVPSDASFWAVRRVSDGTDAQVLARSRLAHAGKPLRTRVDSLPLVTSQRPGLSLRLRRDAESGQSWDDAIATISRDAEFAAGWIRRTGVLPEAPSVLTMVLVDTGTALDVSERGRAADGTTLTLYAPVDAGSQARLSGTLRTALGMLVHELVHVRPHVGNERPLRREQEYRATMFESCYLIDSARIDDRIRLKQTSLHPADYALGSSSEGAGDAIAVLRKVAGADVVDAGAVGALRRLRAHCRRFIGSGSQ